MCISVSKQTPTATKNIAVCGKFVGLSFLAIAGFGLLQRMQAAENTLPARQVSAAPMKIQPKLATSYGKLPLSFEANQGQTDPRVRFLARGSGYTLFLTDDEAVLTLKKSSVVSGQASIAGEILSPVVRGRLPVITKAGQRTPDPGPWTTDAVLRMRLIGANASAAVTGAERTPGQEQLLHRQRPEEVAHQRAELRTGEVRGRLPGRRPGLLRQPAPA